ncbi:MAG: MIP/aquaporin family protein [Actinomycetota bacterium]
MERSLTQKLIVEFIGPFALVFIGVGAIVAAGTPGTISGLIGIAFAHGLVIAVMVSATGHISGGHFNPGVTAGAWIAQKIKSSEAIAYIIVQCLGAIAAAGLLKVALPKNLLSAASGGTPLVNGCGCGISNGQAVLIEAVLTFFLVWVIFGTAMDPDGSFGKIAGLAIGLTIVLDILMGGPFTGAAMNPARSIGPALVFGKWQGWWVYWVGPIAGGIVAGALYDGVLLRTPKAPRVTPTEQQEMSSEQ